MAKFQKNNIRRKKKIYPSVLADSEQILPKKILKALENRKYQARTITGLARELNRSREEIIKAIIETPELRKIIKVYLRRTSNGDLLISTKKRFYNEASLRDKFVDFFSIHRLSVEDAQ